MVNKGEIESKLDELYQERNVLYTEVGVEDRASDKYKEKKERIKTIEKEIAIRERELHEIKKLEKKKEAATLASESIPGMGTIVGAAANKKLNKQEEQEVIKADGKNSSHNKKPSSNPKQPGFFRQYGQTAKNDVKGYFRDRKDNVKNNMMKTATREGRSELKEKFKKTFTDNDIGAVNGLYAAAIFVHFLDVFYLGFAITPGFMASRVILYTVLAIAAHSVYGHKTAWESIQKFWFVYLTPLIFIPLIREYLLKIWFNASVADMMAAFTLAIPFWIIYFNSTIHIESKTKGFFVGLARLWIWFIVVLAIINMAIISSWNIPQIAALQTSPISPSIAVNTLKEFISTTLTDFQGAVKKIYDNTWNNTMGGFYGSHVEDGQNRIGPEIKSFDSINSGKRTYLPNQPIEFSGTITTSGLSEDVHVNLKCQAERTSDFGRILASNVSIIKGTATARKTGTSDFTISSLLPQNSEAVECTFDNSKLTEGRYKIKLIADFNFTTEGYIRYNLMTTDQAYAAVNENTNVYSKYGITKVPVSKFTSGPITVSMGLQGQTNPILLDTDPKKEAGNYIYTGLEITNNNYGGLVQKINSISFMVPSEMVVKCGNKALATSTDKNVVGYTDYVATNFPNAENGIKTKYQFICGANIPAAEVPKLIPQNDKPQDVLIASSVDYNYEMTRTINGINIVADTNAATS